MRASYTASEYTRSAPGSLFFAKLGIFAVTAVAALGSGVFLESLAPCPPGDWANTQHWTRRGLASYESGKLVAPALSVGPLDTLKKSIDALNAQRRSLEQILPDGENAKAHPNEAEASDLIKQNMTLDDYRKVLMQSFKNISDLPGQLKDIDK